MNLSLPKSINLICDIKYPIFCNCVCRHFVPHVHKGETWNVLCCSFWDKVDRNRFTSTSSKPNSSSHVCVSVDFKRFREYCNPVIDEILKKSFICWKLNRNNLKGEIERSPSLENPFGSTPLFTVYGMNIRNMFAFPNYETDLLFSPEVFMCKK